MNKNFFKSALLFCLTALFLSGGTASARGGGPEYYYFGGERVSLIPNYNRMAVGVSDPATVGRLRARWAQYPDARPLPIRSDAELFALSPSGTVLLQFQGAISEARYRQVMTELSMLEGVRFVTPFFDTEHGKRFGVKTQALPMTWGDAALAWANDGVSASEVEVAARNAGLEVVGESKDFPGLYTLRSNGGMATLSAANALYETGLFKSVEPDFIQLVRRNSDDPLYGLQWGHANTGQYGGVPQSDADVQSAWTLTMGSSSIEIAVLDDGVELAHPDLAANIVSGFDATGQGNGGDATTTFNYHGTEVLGVANAVADNMLGGSGVAPGCKSHSIRVFYAIDDFTVISQTSWFVAGFAYARDNADVAVCSWQLFNQSATLNNAIAGAVFNGRGGLGLPIFFSAGNDGLPYVNYPANLGFVFSIAATNYCDERKRGLDDWNGLSCDGDDLWSSQYGAELDFAAPGINMVTTDMTGGLGLDAGDYRTNFFGTSAAAPFAAGVAALVLSANPFLGVSQVYDVLAFSADRVGNVSYTYNNYSHFNEEMGYGRVNAYRAVLMALGDNPTCSRTSRYSISTAQIEDGSDPGFAYGPDLDCRWEINVPGASFVTFTFDRFDVEDGWDFVYIYDGLTTGDPLLGAFTGNNIPQAVTSSSGQMLIRFVSDDIVQTDGWAGRYVSDGAPLPDFCNGLTNLTAPSGTFSDGSGPYNYRIGTTCTWDINVENATGITVGFTYFDVEEDWDFVNIYRHNGTNYVLFASLTGHTIPGDVFVPGNMARVQFVSDELFTYGGFDAYYEASFNQYCSGLLTVAGEQSANIGDGSGGDIYGPADCTYLFAPGSSSPTAYAVVYFTEFALGTGDMLYVYDGSDANAPLLGMFAGTGLPPTLVATQQNVFLRFVADNEDNLSGWNVYIELEGFCTSNVLTARNGAFDDGSGAFNYGNNSNCTWLIAPDGHPGPIRILATGEVEAGWDFVVIYDGPTEESPVLAILTGSFSETVTSTGSQALVAFYSDEIINGQGFGVYYGAQYCDGISIYEAISGTVSDGSGAFEYANLSECYHIIAPPGAEVIELSGDYDLEWGWDYAYIFTWNGFGWSFTEALTGTGSIERTYTAVPGADAAVLVYFVSDEIFAFDGFNFTYNTARVCPRSYNLAIDASEDASENRCEDNPYYINVYSTLEGASFNYLWTKDGEFFSSESGVWINETGSYQVEISGEGCTSASVTLAEPITMTFYSRVTPELAQTTFCVQDGATSLSLFPESLTLWGDGVDNGMFNPAAVGRGMHTVHYAGVYNHCDYEGTFMVQVGGGYDLSYTALDPSCSTCPDGQVVINGETSGLWFALNDQNWQQSNVFQNLVAGTYIVYARDGLGCTQSYAVTLEACDAPSNVTVTQVNPTSVSLSWDAAFGASSYVVRYRPVLGGPWSYWNGTETSAAITGLSPQVRYAIQVQTRCSETSESIWSATILVLTPAEPLPQCANPQWTALVPGFTTTYVEWTSVPAATHYHLQYKKVGISGAWTSINVLAPITSMNIATEPGTQYQIRLRSRCGTTTLAWSEQTLFTTLSARGAETSGAEPMMVVYPNPTRESFNLRFDSPAGTAHVAVFDLSGKVVMTQEITTVDGVNEAQVSLKNFSTGVYLVRLNTADATRSVRLTVE